MAETSKEGQLDITQPLGLCGCLWKLRMISGLYCHSQNLSSQLGNLGEHRELPKQGSE